MECKTSKMMLELVEGENNNEKKLSWSDLLPEILSLILSRLFMGDCVTFHATCKSWQSIHDPLAQHQYLMFRNTRTKLFKFYHPILNSSYQVDIPEIYHCDIRFSKDNWLIMSRSKYDLFFFNPLTKAKIELPDIPFDYVFSRVCFSSNPTASDCIVYGFGDGMSGMEVCTCKKGEEDWKTYEYHSDPSFLYASCSPVVCNGLVYCLSVEGGLGIFDPTSSDPSWVKVVEPSERFGNSERRYLVESEGDLFTVLIAPDWREVDVLRLDSESIEVDALRFDTETIEVDALRFDSETIEVDVLGCNWIEGLRRKVKGGKGNFFFFFCWIISWRESKGRGRKLKSLPSLHFHSNSIHPITPLGLDSETMSWKDVESLGDKMLFVSLKSSFSLKALVKGSGNKVYFPRFNGDDLVFYSLKTKKFHGVSGSVGSIRGSLQAVKEIKQSTWITLYS